MCSNPVVLSFVEFNSEARQGREGVIYVQSCIDYDMAFSPRGNHGQAICLTAKERGKSISVVPS